MSLFIIIFQEGKYTNEKKDRVTMMHIENFIKPLYSVFPTDSFNLFFTYIYSFLAHYCIEGISYQNADSKSELASD